MTWWRKLLGLPEPSDLKREVPKPEKDFIDDEYDVTGNPS